MNIVILWKKKQMMSNFCRIYLYFHILILVIYVYIMDIIHVLRNIHVTNFNVAFFGFKNSFKSLIRYHSTKYEFVIWTLKIIVSLPLYKNCNIWSFNVSVSQLDVTIKQLWLVMFQN